MNERKKEQAYPDFIFCTNGENPQFFKLSAILSKKFKTSKKPAGIYVLATTS